MEYPYYDSTVPVFIRSLKALKGILAKGESFAHTNAKLDGDLLDARLAPDMFPLVKQVQIACDNAKGTAARVAGIEAPKMDDTERTFAELYQRIDRTIAFLESLKPEQFADAGERKVKLPYFKDKHFVAKEFIPAYGLPNFFFHFVTAYDILRNAGVPLGKADFAIELPFRDD